MLWSVFGKGDYNDDWV